MPSTRRNANTQSVSSNPKRAGKADSKPATKAGKSAAQTPTSPRSRKTAQALPAGRRPIGQPTLQTIAIKVKAFANTVSKGTHVLGVCSDNGFSGYGHALDQIMGNTLTRLLKSGDISDKKGAVTVIRQPSGFDGVRLVVVGLGKQADIKPKVFASAAQAAARAVQSLPRGACTWALHEFEVAQADTLWKAACSTQAVLEAAYRFDQTKGRPEDNSDAGASEVVLLANRDEQRAVIAGIAQGEAIISGMTLTKDLGNLPGNICTPTYLATTAQSLGRTHGLSVEVLERKDIEKLKMGSFLSVTKGSAEPPKFIILKYNGGSAKQAPVVLVGKGITFDTGGISIKPAGDMDEMKYDMCGAGTVLGTLKAIAEMKLKLNVIGVIPTCENMPSGTASRPGDVVTSMSGQTIEILNTDAEGRLILCDALTYTERFKPAVVVDIATLTGACIIALGGINTGLFTQDDELADELLAAGKKALDPAWRMPLEDEYQEQIKTPFADMANTGGRMAGSITAACFLARYTKAYRWAHLDIAGTAWKSGANKGASGRPVPLLVNFLKNRAA